MLRWVARLISAASGTVAAGVAINQILNGGVWNLPWLGISLTVAIAAEGLDLWLSRQESSAETNQNSVPSVANQQPIQGPIATPPVVVGDTRSIPIPRQLPREIRHFVDRTAEITALDTFRQSAADLVLISGLPGVGKTAFAIHWANLVRDRFSDGQIYANLHGYDPHPPIPPEEILDNFLRTLDVSPDRIPSSLDAMAGMYRSLVYDKNILVVLDNAHSAAQVQPLLPPSSASCMTLVTSRSKLRSLVIHENAELVVVEPLPEPEALMLFYAVSGSDTSQNRDSLATLVRQCGFLPLTIRITAEHIGAQGGALVDDLVSQLRDEDRRLDIFRAVREDGSVAENVFSWSYRSLRPETARMFRLLSLPTGADLSLPAAAALADVRVAEARRLLLTLTSMNLLEETSTGRYQFHDLIRDYSSERVNVEETIDSRHAALHRLILFYLNTADSADRIVAPHRRHALPEATQPALTFDDPQDALAWCETERPNLMRAINQAVLLGFDDLAWKLPIALIYFFILHGHKLNRLDASLIAADAARRASDRYAEAWAQTCVGGAELALERYEQGLERFQVAVEISREIDEALWAGINLGNIAHALAQLESFDEAVDYATQSLEILRAQGDVRGESIQLGLLGFVLLRLGRLDEAYNHYDAAASAADGVDLQAEGDALQGIGEVCSAQSEHAAAITWYRRSLNVRRRIGDHGGTAETLASVGDAYLRTGEVELARGALTESLELYDALDHPSADIIRQALDQLV